MEEQNADQYGTYYIIVKGDTDGSIEALSDSFIKMSTEKIKVDVIYKAVVALHIRSVHRSRYRRQANA